ncbi:MAG: ABC transporter substrate-binding protein [Firmicutes bacterium]|nr:ABC transporter substrate-binding protein [Bacillota bacterium]
MKKRSWNAVALFLAMALLLVALTGCGDGERGTAEKPTIVVGSKTFTEALLLGTMTYEYLKDLGYDVEDQVGLGELAIIRPALLSGEVSCYWEYTGTVLINVMEDEPSFDEEACYQAVKEWDEAENGIIWLDYAPLNNTYAIMVRGDIAEEYKLEKTSDFVALIEEGVSFKFVGAQEWVERPDGLQHWENIYDFKYPDKDMTQAELNIGYETLREEQADAGLAFTTDPRVKAYGIVALEDDKSAFPVYNAAPLFRKEIIDAYPDIPEQIKKLSSLLDDETIMELNKAVDVDKKMVEEVAKQFLKDNGLIQ